MQRYASLCADNKGVGWAVTACVRLGWVIAELGQIIQLTSISDVGKCLQQPHRQVLWCVGMCV